MDLKCPVCKSSRIKPYSENETMAKYFGSTDTRYICEDCGYIGALILDISADEFKDKNPVEDDLKEISNEINESYNRKRCTSLTHSFSLFYLFITIILIWTYLFWVSELIVLAIMLWLIRRQMKYKTHK